MHNNIELLGKKYVFYKGVRHPTSEKRSNNKKL